jgi:bifunctional non-homologous end joining protein LigD
MRRVRLFTRRGYDWADRFPAITAAALKLRAKSFTIDGEAVVAGADGVAAFDELRKRRRYGDAFLWAFDLLELNGDDIRPLPFVKRKVKLALLLALSPAGIVLNDHIEAEGSIVFAEAYKIRLEGIVSKKIDAPYRSGKLGDWIKVRNPGSAAAKRFENVGDGT